MAQPLQKIYKGRDLWVPAFEVKIRQKDLPAVSSHDILSVRYSDATDQIDNFELTVNNWDASTRNFKYTGTTDGKNDKPNPFDPGQEIELWMGYWKPTDPETRDPEKPDPLRLMLAGVITSINPTFPATGQPTVKVTGQNVLRTLLTKQNTFAYKNKRDSEIAEEVGRRGGMKIGSVVVKVKTDPFAKSNEAVHEHLIQDNQYDLLFLLERAHRNGYDVVLKYASEGGKMTPFLAFGPAEANPPAYELEWGRSLIQFSPTLTTTRQVSKVTVRFWNGKKKKVETVTVDRKQLGTKPIGDEATLDRMYQGLREREDIICDEPFLSKDAAKKFAQDRLERIAREFVTGKGSTVGTPDLRAGGIIQISGLGKIFSGRYVVKSTTHTIGAGGYITEFDARMEETK